MGSLLTGRASLTNEFLSPPISRVFISFFPSSPILFLLNQNVFNVAVCAANAGAKYSHPLSPTISNPYSLNLHRACSMRGTNTGVGLQNGNRARYAAMDVAVTLALDMS